MKHFPYLTYYISISPLECKFHQRRESYFFFSLFCLQCLEKFPVHSKSLLNIERINVLPEAIIWLRQYVAKSPHTCNYAIKWILPFFNHKITWDLQRRVEWICTKEYLEPLWNFQTHRWYVEPCEIVKSLVITSRVSLQSWCRDQNECSIILPK